MPTTGGGGGGGAVTIADGADVNAGSTTDTAVTTDTNATLSAKLRGLVKILGDVWDSVNSRLKVAVEALVTADNRSVSGAITAGGETVELAVNGCGTAVIGITGTWSGTIVFEATAHEVTWTTVFGVVPNVGRSIQLRTSNGHAVIACAGYRKIRARAVSLTSGTATVEIQASSGSQAAWFPSGSRAFDFDTVTLGADVGTGFGIALPSTGGAVLGGTPENPIHVDLNHTEPESPARVALTNSSEQTLVAAPGVGLSIYVTDMTGSNEGGQRTRVDLKEGAGGTVRYSYVMAQNGGGFAHSLRSAWKLPENTALAVQQTANVSSYVTVNHFVSA